MFHIKWINLILILILILNINSICVTNLNQNLYAESIDRISAKETNYWGRPDNFDYLDYIQLFDEYRGTGQKQINSKNTILSILKLLKKRMNARKKSSLLIRLSNAYMDFGLKTRKKELNLYNDMFTKWLFSNKLEKIQMPNGNFRESFNYFEKAIKNIRESFEIMPRLLQDADLLYKIGNLLLLVKNSNAQLYFNKIISLKNTNELLKYKAYFGIAEYFYQQENYDEAEKMYSKVIKSNISGLKEYADYKKAWILSIKNSLKIASQKFENIVLKKNIKSKSFKNSSAFQYLRNEASKDLVWLWSELKYIKYAKIFFIKTISNQKFYNNMLERLAWNSLKNNDLKSSYIFLNDLFKYDPERTSNIVYRYRLMELSFIKDQPLWEYKQAKQIIFYTNKESAPWYQGNKENTALIDNYNINTYEYITKKSTYYFEKFKQTNDPKYLKASYLLLKLILKYFRNKSASIVSQHYYSRTLDLLGKYPQAVEEYKKTTLMKNAINSHKSYAANRMIDIQLGLIAKKNFSKNSDPWYLEEPKKIPFEINKFIELSKLFVNLYPHDKRSNILRLKVGIYYLEHGNYDKSFSILNEIIKLSPSSDEAETSVKLISTYFAKNRKIEELAKWSETFYKYENKFNKKLFLFVENNYKKSKWIIAKNHEKSGNKSKAVDSFIEFQKIFPNDKYSDLALYKASSISLDENEKNKAIQYSQVLINKYKNSKYSKNILIKISRYYQSKNQYKKSAEAFESYYTMYPTDKKTPQVLYHASVLYKELENLDRCSYLLEIIINKYPHSKYAEKSVLNLATNYVTLNQEKKAAKYFELYLKKNKNKNSEDKLFAEVYLAILNIPRDYKLNHKTFMKFELHLKTKPRDYAIEARIELSKYYLKVINEIILDFKQYKIAYYNFNQYQNSIKFYKSKLATVENYFARLFIVADPINYVKSCYIIGDNVYEEVFRQLKEKWSLTGISDKDRKLIIDTKEKLLLSLRQKQLNILNKGFNYAENNDIYTNYRNKIYNKLSQLDSDKL